MPLGAGVSFEFKVSLVFSFVLGGGAVPLAGKGLISVSNIFLKFELLLSVATDSLITVNGRLGAGISGTAAVAILMLLILL